MAGGVRGRGVAGEMATGADGTHPTGMHSCYFWIHYWKHVKCHVKFGDVTFLVITTRKRRLGQGNVFTLVFTLVHGGGVSASMGVGQVSIGTRKASGRHTTGMLSCLTNKICKNDMRSISHQFDFCFFVLLDNSKKHENHRICGSFESAASGLQHAK